MELATKNSMGFALSEEEPAGIKIGEKFFGILILFIGFLLFYFAYTSYSTLASVVFQVPTIVPAIFLFFGGLLMVVGVVLILARQD